MSEDITKKIRESRTRRVWGLDVGGSEEITFVSDFREGEIFQVRRHETGRRSVLCPGEEVCAACQAGQDVTISWAITVLDGQGRRTLMLLRYTNQGLLKRFVTRYERLKETREDPSMRGERAYVTRPDAFTYEVEWLPRDESRVAKVHPFTYEEVIERLRGRGGNE